MSLASRSDAAERMDTDCRDYGDYRACLRDLARVNALTRTHAPVLRWLARAVGDAPAFSLLDFGAGHGDLLRAIERWAARRGKTATLTGVDLNPWAVRAAGEFSEPGSTIRYVAADVFEHVPQVRPDFVVSSQMAHHLDDATLERFLRLMDATSVRGWLVVDPRRHWFPYYGFPLLARAMFWHRFVRYDGQVSVARSLTRDEWRARLDAAGFPDATLTAAFPFRLCASRMHDQ
jgi:2-polyprenyl-3-methyl-5-hydroxy-6-metoxy-1,4-benzoquinol methylase